VSSSTATGIEASGEDEECPFEDDLEDDSALTVPELLAGMRAAMEGSSIDPGVAVAPEGHLELAEDADIRPRDATKMTIEEILNEVDVSGRGKRRRFKRHRYEDAFES
jgi:hypothetical protein